LPVKSNSAVPELLTDERAQRAALAEHEIVVLDALAPLLVQLEAN